MSFPVLSWQLGTVSPGTTLVQELAPCRVELQDVPPVDRCAASGLKTITSPSQSEESATTGFRFLCLPPPAFHTEITPARRSWRKEVGLLAFPDAKECQFNDASSIRLAFIENPFE